MVKGDGCEGWQSSKRAVMTERQMIEMMEFNTEVHQIDRSQNKTTQRALGLLKQRNRYIELCLTQLSSEQMKQCEWQGEQCSRESGGRVCVNVVLICRAIKRVKGSRWAASIPSVSANELARFTASTH